MAIRTNAEIVGPFKEYRLVVNGWRVPLMSAQELDGGRVTLTFDNRQAIEVDAGDFEGIASFMADVIAGCLGYMHHPYSDETYADHEWENRFDNPETFRHVPHPLLRPRRTTEITTQRGDEE